MLCIIKHTYSSFYLNKCSRSLVLFYDNDVLVGCRNNGETLRTLRFGQRVKFIKNDPVINEISEDDVNDLSDQIRQLKV